MTPSPAAPPPLLPQVHGAPVHVGAPAALGIADLSQPDFGDAVTLRPGEVPVFWACGVTAQLALQGAIGSVDELALLASWPASGRLG